MKTRITIVRNSCKYNIRRASDLSAIVPGCTIFEVDTNPETLGRFETTEAAKAALASYASDIRAYDARSQRGYLVNVTEYAVVEEDIEIDEDGDEYETGTATIAAVTPFLDDLHIFGEDYTHDEKYGWKAAENG
jgi:hypothetical protein